MMYKAEHKGLAGARRMEHKAEYTAGKPVRKAHMAGRRAERKAAYKARPHRPHVMPRARHVF